MKAKLKYRNRRGIEGLFFRNIRLTTETFILLEFIKNPGLRLEYLTKEIEISK